MVRSSAYGYKRGASQYYVDGKHMLNPDENIEISYSDIEGRDSGYDINGTYHRAIIRTGVRSWTFSYKILTSAEYMYLRSVFAGKNTFSFEFFNEMMTKEVVTAYCTWGNVAYKSQNSGQYRNLKITITEC